MSLESLAHHRRHAAKQLRSFGWTKEIVLTNTAYAWTRKFCGFQRTPGFERYLQAERAIADRLAPAPALHPVFATLLAPFAPRRAA